MALPPRSPSDEGSCAGPADPATRELNRLRREVELQEERVRLLEVRKQQRDALLAGLRATLARAQPEGFRDLHTAAEQLLADIGALSDTQETTMTLPSPPEPAEEVDEVRVVFSASVEAQLAEAEEEADTEAGLPQTHTAETVDDFLTCEETRAARDVARRRHRRKKRRAARAAQGEQASRWTAHTDPQAAPEGFDASKAREAQQRRAAEVEAHRARVCALLEGFVAKVGPLPPPNLTGTPAWLEEGEDGEAQAAPLPVAQSAPAGERVGPEEEYPDDFESEED